MASPTIPRNYGVGNPRNNLSADYVRSVLDYDPATGEFRWRWCEASSPQRNAQWAGKIAGATGAHGYRQIKIDGRPTLAHRLAWLIITDEWPAEEIDHINLDPADNRFGNLREATSAENKRNTRVQASNKTGIKGVSWHKAAGKLVAQIKHEGKSHHLGLFDILAEAAAAIAKKRADLHGEFGRDQ